jgi:protein phosphatase
VIVRHAFATHVGCIRTENQDAYADLSEHGVFAIADGMGGHRGGREASQLAVKAFAWQCDHGREQTSEYIIQAHKLIVRANQERNQGALQALNGGASQMGTTGVVVYLNERREEYFVSWCGDSRLYQWMAQTGKLEQVTIDHSVVQGRLGRGEITAEQAQYEKKNMLEHAIGVGGMNDIHVDTRRRRIAPGDMLMLCTDGISNEIEPDILLDLFGQAASRGHDARHMAQQILRAALDGGGTDNATVAIIQTQEEDF